jgi:1-acyl-sn-glycerol-3-phosphate acyltransferase
MTDTNINQAYEDRRDLAELPVSLNIWAPVYALRRFSSTLSWVLLCYAAIRFAGLVAMVRPAYGRALRLRIARRWIEGMPSRLGLRVSVDGTAPQHPYFLVNNHITWIDFIVMNALCDARCVAMAELQTIPIVGTLVRGLNPILVKRVRRDTPRVLALMIEALESGESLQMAPEGVISPGRSVKRFRAALLEAAVHAGRSVHYASITYRTQADRPPASRVVLFGPDPHYTPAPGEVSEEELAAWGPQHTFFGHLFRLLAEPQVEVAIRFAQDPLRADDAVALANDLRRGVRSIFTPVN